MVDQQLIDYTKQQLQKGKDRETISLASPIDLLRDAWNLYRARIKTLLGVVILPMLVVLVLTLSAAVFGYLSFSGFLKPASIFSSTNMMFPGGISVFVVITFFILVVLFVIGSVVIQMWGQVALIIAVRDSDEAIGIKESFRRSRNKILSYWWVMVLMSFVVMGGFLLFIIPGVIFVVWFSFAIYVLVSEDVRGMNALLKSREYVKGRFFAVFGRFLFLGLFSFVVYIVPSVLLELLDLSLVSTIYSWVVSLVLSPMVVIYSLLLYKNVKSIKGEFEFTPTTKSKVALVVVGIVGFILIPIIFITIIIFAINPSAQMSKARDAMRRNDQVSIRNSLEIYYVDEGEYPASLNQLIPVYLSRVPTDPDSELEYEYVQLEDGGSYQLCVEYESEPRECIDPMSTSLMERMPSY